jgi:eukaryotic-like serine/threonine-protein kinase
MAEGDVTQADAAARPLTGERGTVFAGRYRVVRRLGRGGMATVFLAVDERLARKVALKRLHSDSPEDAASRFAREARLGAALNHPNLVAVYDAVADGDGVLIVMEYVPGRNLAQLLSEGALELDRALRVLRATAAAIDHAHAHGIVHRDVKPANVLIRDDGQTKLADLGVAKALEDTALTDTNVALGTPTYMSPEQLAGKRAGPATDVYSLGLIAFESLSGERARTGSTPLEQARQAEIEPPPDLRRVRTDLPAAAAGVLKQALDRRPDRRPGSAEAFVRNLETALRGRPDATATVPQAAPPIGQAPPGRATDGKSPARLYAFAAIAAVAVAIAAIVMLAGGGDSGPATGDRASGDGPARQAESVGGEPTGGDASIPAATDDEAAAPTSGETETAEGPASPPPGDPATAVEQFYELSAAGDTKEAWELATGNFRSQLGGYSSFAAQMADLESIEFSRLETISESGETATVSFADAATHTDHVDYCNGTFTLVAGSQGWQVDQAQEITCERG